MDVPLRQRYAPEFSTAFSGRTAAQSLAGSSFVALDLMRGLAALLVVLVHVRQTSFVEFMALPADDRNLTTGFFYALTRSGNEAVLTFFVLSGLLVGGQIVARVGQGAFDWRAYAIDRVSRIFLPLIPAIILSGAIGAVFLGHAPGLWSMLAHVAGLNGVFVETMLVNRPLWSLAYEIWFYVIGGSLAYILARGPDIRAIALLSVGLFCMANLDSRYFLIWGLGAAASLYPALTRPGLLFAAGLPVAAAGALINQFNSPTHTLDYLNALVGIDGAMLLAIGICFMIPFLCGAQVSALLEPLRRPAGWLAGFSYSLYLFHAPVNEALGIFLPQAGEIDPASVGIFWLKVAICVAASWLFYLAFERNTHLVRRALKRRFGGLRER